MFLVLIWYLLLAYGRHDTNSGRHQYRGNLSHIFDHFGRFSCSFVLQLVPCQHVHPTNTHVAILDTEFLGDPQPQAWQIWSIHITSLQPGDAQQVQ